MNCYELSEKLDEKNIEYYFDEIFYDENENEIMNYDDFDENEYDDIYEYLFDNYLYDYELIIILKTNKFKDIKKIDELIKDIDNDIELISIDKDTMKYRNKE